MTDETATDEGKHTPGPWELTDKKPTDSDRYDFVITRADGYGGRPWKIASVHNSAPERPDHRDAGSNAAEANARLIAAAPELLDAARKLRDRLEYADPHEVPTEQFDALKDAIDKATP